MYYTTTTSSEHFKRNYHCKFYH